MTLKINPGGRLQILSSGSFTMNGSGPISQLVGTSGGTVPITGPVSGSISIPAGALSENVTITATTVSAAGVNIAQSSTVGAALQLGPEGQTFSSPVTITISVGTLPAGVSIYDLVIYTAPVGSNSYTALTTTVVNGQLCAQVSHFSNFVVAYSQIGSVANPKSITPGFDSIETFSVDAGQSMYYKFTLADGKKAHIYVGGSSLDTVLAVYESSDLNTAVTSNDDSISSDAFMSWNSYASLTNNSGSSKQYVIQASGHNGRSLTNAIARVILQDHLAVSTGPTVDTGLVAWFKADSITGASDGDTVSVWNDSSGSGQTMMGNPTYVASDSHLGGQPSLSFSGGKTLTEYFDGYFPSGASARTLYVVGYLNNTRPEGSAISYGRNGNGVRFALFASNNGLYIETSNYTSKGASISNGSGFVAAYPYTAASHFEDSPLYLNGAEGALPALGAGGGIQANTAETKLAMGYLSDLPSGWYNWDGAIAEVLIYDSAHDDYARYRVETYLKNKYGFSYSLTPPNQNTSLSTFSLNSRVATDGASIFIESPESPSDSGQCSLTVNVATKDPAATIVDGYGNVISFPYTISVADGDSSIVSFTVIAADGVTTKDYSVTANINKITPETPGINNIEHFDILGSDVRRFSFSLAPGATAHCYATNAIVIRIYEGTSPVLSQNTLVSDDRICSPGSDPYMSYWSVANYKNTSNVTKNYVATASAWYGGGGNIYGCAFRVIVQEPDVVVTTPTQDTGLVAWYKVDSLTGLADGATVTKWSSSSGQDNFILGNMLYVAADSNMNGMPSLSLSGGRYADEFFNGELPEGTAARTMYVVGSANSSGNFGMMVGYGYNNALGGRFGIFDNRGNIFLEACGAGSGSVATSRPSGFVASYASKAGSKMNQNTFHLNGISATTSDAGVLNTPVGYRKLVLGYLAGYLTNGGYNWDGSISEVLIYDSAHDDYARYRVETYLKNKYGFGFSIPDPAKNTDLDTWLVNEVSVNDGGSYNIQLPESSPGSGSCSFTVSATTHDAGATITDGSGNTLSFPLTVSGTDGEAVNVSFTVVSADGTTTKDYSITVNTTVITNFGSGTFEDPFILINDNTEREYQVTFGDDKGAFFKCHIDQTMMGTSSHDGWTQATWFANHIMTVFRATWTPPFLENPICDHQIDIRAVPISAIADGKYYDNWGNYHESDPKTAFFNIYGNVIIYASNSYEPGGYAKHIGAYIRDHDTNSTIGDIMIYIPCQAWNPAVGRDYTGGTVTALSKLMIP